MTATSLETLDEQIARLTAERDAQPAAVAAVVPAPAPAPGPLSRPELPLFALAALALLGCVLLVALGHAVPEFLQAVTLATVTGGAGALAPRSAPAASSATVAVSS